MSEELTFSIEASTRLAADEPRSWASRLLALELEEASFKRRGFVADDPAPQQLLESVGRAFIHGYNCALGVHAAADIEPVVERFDPFFRGFVAEGAAMGTAIRDAFSIRPAMLPAVLDVLGPKYTYLLHVGCGWAIARVPWRRARIEAALDPFLLPLARDGQGFHAAYFKPAGVLAASREPRRRKAERALDQGIGRALWFVFGGSIDSITGAVASFHRDRQTDLWSGLGLAMAYAGGCRSEDFEMALHESGANASEFAQGVAFACAARALSVDMPAATELAAAATWGCSAVEVADEVNLARRALRSSAGPSNYEAWQQAVAIRRGSR